MTGPLPAQSSEAGPVPAPVELDAGQQARMVQALRAGLAARLGQAVGLLTLCNST